MSPNNRHCTRHALVRMQQRALPPLAIELLDRHGRIEFDGHNAEVIYFDKRAWKRVEKELGYPAARLLVHYRSAYYVQSNGKMVTAGYRDTHLSRR